MANTKVTGDVIANGTISTVHIADDAITAAKLDSTATGITFADLAVSGNSTFTGNVTVNGAFTSRGIDDNADATAITINGNEEVGIGTTSPFTKLHVETTASSIARFSYNSTNYQDLTYEGSNIVGGSHVFKIAGSEKMRLDASGNVGIGTTLPGAKLHVDNTAADAVIRLTKGSSTIGNIDFVNEGNRFSIQDDGTRRLIIDTSGNVGIGETSPDTALDVVGGNADSVVDTLTLKNDNTGNSAGAGINFVVDGANDVVTSAIYGQRTAAAYHQGSLQFLTRDASGGGLLERMRITSAGYVGIGTPSPSTLLHINGSGDAIRVESTNTGAGGAQMDLLHYTTSPANEDVHGVINFGGYYSGTSSAYGSAIKSIWTDVANRLGRLTFYTRNTSNFNAVMTVNHEGNVGIGTTSPAQKLTIDGTVSGAYVRISNAGSGDVSSGYMIYNGSNLDFNVYTNPTFGNTTLLTREALAIRAGGTERMRITSGGDIQVQGGDIFLNSGTNYNDKGVVYLSNERTAIISDIVNLTANGDTSLDFQTRSGGSRASAMFIDEFRNVGIGTDSPLNKFDLRGTAYVTGYTVGFDTSPQGNYAYRLTNDGANSFINLQGGNLGIGTTSPNAKLDVKNDDGVGNGLHIIADFNRSAGTDAQLLLGYYANGTSVDGPVLYSANSKPLLFAAGGSERMRITSGGYVFIGGNSNLGYDSHNIKLSAPSSYALIVRNSDTSTTNQSVMQFNRAETTATTQGYCVIYRQGDTATGTNRWIVYANGNIQNTNNSYGSLSDERKKENIVDATPKLDDLMKVKVRNFNLKGEKTKQIGVVAQELEEVFPGMIDESKTPDSEDETLYKGVKYSVFVPILIKAIQEQQKIINDLKNRIQTLENN